VFKVPHEGGGVEEVDGGDAETGWRGRIHWLLGYQSDVMDSAWVSV
jgi:hypothetical protein